MTTAGSRWGDPEAEEGKLVTGHNEDLQIPGAGCTAMGSGEEATGDGIVVVVKMSEVVAGGTYQKEENLAWESPQPIEAGTVDARHRYIMDVLIRM